MRRYWRIVLAYLVPVVCLGTFVVSLRGPLHDLWQNYRSGQMRDASQHIPTVKVNFGVVTRTRQQSDTDKIAMGKAIQTLSGKFKNNTGQFNVEILWAYSATPNDMPGVISYYAPVQMLEYNPEVLGTTYRYESVSPTLLHQLAAKRADDFHQLTEMGCRETIYEND